MIHFEMFGPYDHYGALVVWRTQAKALGRKKRVIKFACNETVINGSTFKTVNHLCGFLNRDTLSFST